MFSLRYLLLVGCIGDYLAIYKRHALYSSHKLHIWPAFILEREFCFHLIICIFRRLLNSHDLVFKSDTVNIAIVVSVHISTVKQLRSIQLAIHFVFKFYQSANYVHSDFGLMVCGHQHIICYHSTVHILY